MLENNIGISRSFDNYHDFLYFEQWCLHCLNTRNNRCLSGIFYSRFPFFFREKKKPWFGNYSWLQLRLDSSFRAQIKVAKSKGYCMPVDPQSIGRLSGALDADPALLERAKAALQVTGFFLRDTCRWLPTYFLCKPVFAGYLNFHWKRLPNPPEGQKLIFNKL